MRDLLRLYRVRDWIHILPLPLATFDPTAPLSGGLFAAARGVASAFTILAFGFLLNSVADRRLDLDALKNPLILPDAREQKYSLAALLTVAIMLAALAPFPAQMATLSCLVLGYVYSLGPRLKAVPIAGSLANVAGFASLLFLGMRDSTLPSGFEHMVLAFAALLLQNQLIHEAADRIEDLAARVRTTWLTLGPRWTALIAMLSGLGAVAAAMCIPAVAHVRIFVGAAVIVFGIMFPLLLFWRGNESRYAASLRVAHRWSCVVFGAGLFSAWRWPS